MSDTTSPALDPNSLSVGSVDTSRKLLNQQIASLADDLEGQSNDYSAGLDAIIAAINAKPSA